MGAASEAATMSENAPDRPPKGEILRTLSVRRNAIRGFTAGALFAVALYVVFVVLPGSTFSPVLFVGLAFVVAMTSGAIVTAILVAITAYGVARRTS